MCTFFNVEVPQFSFYYFKDQFNHQVKEFLYTFDLLSVRDIEDYNMIWDYVCSLIPYDIGGSIQEALFDFEGDPLKKARFISTYQLVSERAQPK